MRISSVSTVALANVPTVLSTSVHLDIACQGINHISKFSLSEKIFAHGLQDSYNTTTTAPSTISPSRPDLLQQTKPLSRTGYELENAVSGSFGAKQKRENEFILGLIETGRKNFKDVKTCDIQLTAAGSTVAEEEAPTVGETTKCGLRACTEE